MHSSQFIFVEFISFCIWKFSIFYSPLFRVFVLLHTLGLSRCIFGTIVISVIFTLKITLIICLNYASLDNIMLVLCLFCVYRITCNYEVLRRLIIEKDKKDRLLLNGRLEDVKMRKTNINTAQLEQPRAHMRATEHTSAPQGARMRATSVGPAHTWMRSSFREERITCRACHAPRSGSRRIHIQWMTASW